MLCCPDLYFDLHLSSALEFYNNGAVRALCCATLILWLCSILSSRVLQQWSSEGSMLCHTYTLTSTYPQLSSLTAMEQWGLYAMPHLYCDFALSSALESYNKGAVMVLCVSHLYCDLYLSSALESYNKGAVMVLCVSHLYCDLYLSSALESYNKGAVMVLCVSHFLWPLDLGFYRFIRKN